MDGSVEARSVDAAGVVASGGDGCVGRLRCAVALFLCVDIVVVDLPVVQEGDDCVGRKDGRKSAVVDAAIGPLGMARVAVGVGAQFELPGGGKLVRFIGNLRPRVCGVSEVGRERFDFGESERVAESILYLGSS